MSNATCLIWPHLCYARFVLSRITIPVKDHHILQRCLPLLKKTCVRQVVLDKLFPLSQARSAIHALPRELPNLGRGQARCCVLLVWCKHSYLFWGGAIASAARRPRLVAAPRPEGVPSRPPRPPCAGLCLCFCSPASEPAECCMIRVPEHRGPGRSEPIV